MVILFVKLFLPVILRVLPVNLKVPALFLSKISKGSFGLRFIIKLILSLSKGLTLMIICYKWSMSLQNLTFYAHLISRFSKIIVSLNASERFLVFLR